MTPEVGLVIRHIYLWRDEHKREQIEGRKARPCLIIHTRLNEHGEIEVYICPVTHTQPEISDQSIEIPLATKQRLKLDNQRSWIITSEVNLFKWKGPDVRKQKLENLLMVIYHIDLSGRLLIRLNIMQGNTAWILLNGYMNQGRLTDEQIA